MSIAKDTGKSSVKRCYDALKKVRCRVGHRHQVRAKNNLTCAEEPEKAIDAVKASEDHESNRLALYSEATGARYHESTSVPSSKALRKNAPAPPMSDATNSEPDPPRMRKKGDTFPITAKRMREREARGMTDFINNKSKVEGMAQLNSGSVEDSRKFVREWELKLLPKLEEVLDSNDEGEYSINIRQGEKGGYRIIEIMTTKELKGKVRTLLEETKSTCLDKDIGSRTTMRLCVGTLEFLVDEAQAPSPTSTQSEESWYAAINTRRYTNPVMGDSVGPKEGGSATMGPLLQIAQKFYRILNWHVFDDKGTNRRCEEPIPPPLKAYHPSLDDSSENNQVVGETVAYSGRMHETWRVSRSIQSAMNDAFGAEAETSTCANTVKTVTDWVLVEDIKGHQVNKVRKADMPTPERCDSFEREITKVADPKYRISCPNNMPQLVYSTGRSSGHSFGQICEVPAHHTFPSGVKTRNWGVESTHSPDQDWDRGGMGVPGDSGAPVIDKQTHSLLGQIWGRDKYKAHPQRRQPITYFTAMSDIYDDIRDRMPDWGTPRLPTNPSLSTDGSPPASPARRLPIRAPIPNEEGRRPTLASISEDADERSIAQTESSSQRRSVARPKGRLITELHRSTILPSVEPLRRWATIIHAATF
ncbi:hypothetical protein F4804DRAFT_338749 [Jackrogersella minutella]|nr:hypothetical protein F4804DRAFT_338749 [Jackrogersella minutella]